MGRDLATLPSTTGINRATLLACSLDVAIELLAQAIRQNALISGILVGERKHKITLYTDDVLTFLS